MKRRRIGSRFGALATTVLLASCAYQADVPVSPSYSVVSSYGSKLPGTWLLYVEASKLDREIKPSSLECSAHRFPIKAANSFKVSAVQTIGNVVESVEMVQSPLDGPSISQRGAKGQIIIRGEDVRARIEGKSGVLTVSMDTQATVVASISVNGTKGRLLGQTVEGTGYGNGGAGAVCKGGAAALSAAVSQGVSDVMRKLGEAVSNSERVRTASY